MSNWPDDETVLNRLRQWLDEAHAEADASSSDGASPDAPTELRPVGLFQMIEEFTALRHELASPACGKGAWARRSSSSAPWK